MKKKNLFILGIITLFTFILASCGSNEIGKHDKLTPVIFELEGGSYRSSTDKVKHYYDLKNAESMLIKELTDASQKELSRPEYEFVGWYRVKEVNGSSVTYKEPWNFSSDRITKEGVTLYAYWRKKINLVYNVCYKNEQNEVVVIGSYAVFPDEEETLTFNDRLKYANKRDGYTAIGYLDSENQPWDSEFVHPCDEENPAVNVFVDYIEGDYIIARTADDLINAANNNVYLMNDIDMEGEKLSFGNYEHVFKGNGHTIKNFEISYTVKRDELQPDINDPTQNSLYISLFGDMNNASITDVSFENAIINISTSYSGIYKIYVSPIAKSLTNSCVSNVKYSGVTIIKNLPEAFINIVEGNKEINFEKLICVSDNAYVVIDDKSQVENLTINSTVDNQLK